MKSRPILFNAEMVRAVLDGRKTQTRRVMKGIQPEIAAIFLRTDGCHAIHTTIGGLHHGKINFEAHSSIAKRRLYGWERWEDLLKNEIQRIWEEGVRGLVSIKWAPVKKRILDCVLVSREQEGNQVYPQAGLYGISWDADRYLNASKAFGRNPRKQQTIELEMGHTGGKLEGQEGAREGERRREASDVQTDGQGERSYRLGSRKGVGFAKAYCQDVGDVTVRYRENLRFEVGRELWVRETWRTLKKLDDRKPLTISSFADVEFRAGGLRFPNWSYNSDDEKTLRSGGKWRPSIFMPRWASRITLTITDVRVERVQEITAGDAGSEGVDGTPAGPCQDGMIYDVRRDRFRTLWDSINEKRGYGWDKNPWVWVVEFEVKS